MDMTPVRVKSDVPRLSLLVAEVVNEVFIDL
jgi:hypothetical protein